MKRRRRSYRKKWVLVAKDPNGHICFLHYSVNLDDVKAYFSNPERSKCYLLCMQMTFDIEDAHIFYHKADARKLVACLTANYEAEKNLLLYKLPEFQLLSL